MAMESTVKRVAIVLPGDLPVPSVLGGAIESTVQLIVEQNEIRQHLDVTVFSVYDEVAKRQSLAFKHAHFVWIRKGRLFRVLNFILRVFRKIGIRTLDPMDGQILKSHARKTEFDRIVVHGNVNHLLALAKAVPKERLVFYKHAKLFERRTALSLAAGQSAGRYVAVSEFIKRTTVANMAVSPDRVAVIRNPIDWDKLNAVVGAERPEDLVQRYSILPKEVVVLFAGRIIESKGVRHLLMAMQSLPADIGIRLLIVGSFGSSFGKGDDRDAFCREMTSFAAALGHRVVFTGFIHNSEMSRYYALSDIVVMPSLCDESAGKVAMEGMASGRAVITTRAGGIPEYVTKECGILLDRGDAFVSDLGAAILDLAQDAAKRRRMGTAGALESGKFAPAIYYADYVKLVSDDADSSRSASHDAS